MPRSASDDFADLGPAAIPNRTLDRYLRSYITLPDGRRIAGRKPGRSGVSCAEHLLRDELARTVHGITEASLDYGRADVMTGQAVFEVESATKWRHGVRQVLAYSAACGLPPSLALFGEAKNEEVLRIYLKLRDGQPKIDLWWFGSGAWLPITARTHCRCMPAHTLFIGRLKEKARRTA